MTYPVVVEEVAVVERRVLELTYCSCVAAAVDHYHQ